MTVEVDVTSPTAVTVDTTEGVTIGGLQAERNARIAGDAATLASAAADATAKANAAEAAANVHADAGDAATLAAAALDATTKTAAATAAAADYADTGDDLVREQLLDRIDGTGGQPVLTYAEVGYLDDGDLYLGPKVIPGDDVEMRVGYDGELIVVTPATLDLTEGNDPRLSDARTPLAHVHDESDVTGLAADLASKAVSGHTHTEADITDLTMDPVVAALIFGGI